MTSLWGDLLAECEMFWPSHKVDRWWDALLRLEAATGFRIPGWAPVESVRLQVDGQPMVPEWFGNCIFAPPSHGPATIQVEYDLPITYLDEVTDGVNDRFIWRGNEILAMTPNARWLPFYPE